jgi:hypothetical protein
MCPCRLGIHVDKSLLRSEPSPSSSDDGDDSISSDSNSDNDSRTKKTALSTDSKAETTCKKTQQVNNEFEKLLGQYTALIPV